LFFAPILLSSRLTSTGFYTTISPLFSFQGPVDFLQRRLTASAVPSVSSTYLSTFPVRTLRLPVMPASENPPLAGCRSGNLLSRGLSTAELYLTTFGSVESIGNFCFSLTAGECFSCAASLFPAALKAAELHLTMPTSTGQPIISGNYQKALSAL